jgi:alpha-tubulin suppressor-like RCC1 family protein
MNIANLQILLQEAIDNATKTVDYLLLAKAVETLNVGQIRAVTTYANLPNAASNEGLLVFVEADERLYWSTGSAWYNLIDENKGLAWAWGQNIFNGRLGDNTTVGKSSPVSVVGGFTDWCLVSAGDEHSLGIRTNGTIWSWGDNGSGRLGNNATTDRSSPVSVVGGFTDWCQASAGGCHSIGLRQNGTLWAWGSGADGRLGDNTTVNKSSPVSVVGDFTDWCQVSAGGAHSVAVRQNGTLWAWGSGSFGRLGDDTNVTRSSPVSVVGDFTDWCQTSAGFQHSLGVRTTGTIWAWGINGGRLGDNTSSAFRSSPVSVAGGFTDWCQASAGVSHSLGIRQNGTLWAWGGNGVGQLGDGTAVTASSPVSVIGGFTDWCQASAGNGHSLGIRQNGTIWAWGSNSGGILGDGTTVSTSSPVSVIGGFTDWCQVSSGCVHSLALRKTDFAT